MTMMRTEQQVMVRLTAHQALWMARLGEHLWPSEKDLGIGEIGRRLLLEYLLWREDELRLVERERDSSTVRVKGA